MSTAGRTPAFFLLAAVSSVFAYADDATVGRKFALLRDRLEAAKYHAPLPSMRRTAGSISQEPIDLANQAHDIRGSQIIERPALPDPDTAAIRKSLGLRQLSAHDTLRPPNAEESPTPADLAESDAVRLTPEIRSLA